MSRCRGDVFTRLGEGRAWSMVRPRCRRARTTGLCAEPPVSRVRDVREPLLGRRRGRGHMILELPDTLLEALAQRVAAMTEQAPARQWFNAEQAGEYLGTTRDGITALVKCGQLEPTRRKPHYLFSRATLDREREAA